MVLTGVIRNSSAVYGSIEQIKDIVGEDQFVFLRVFTTAKEPLLSFVQFLAILIPIIAIALGFDSVNSEFSRRTMSRVLAPLPAFSCWMPGGTTSRSPTSSSMSSTASSVRSKLRDTVAQYPSRRHR